MGKQNTSLTGERLNGNICLPYSEGRDGCEQDGAMREPDRMGMFIFSISDVL